MKKYNFGETYFENDNFILLFSGKSTTTSRSKRSTSKKDSRTPRRTSGSWFSPNDPNFMILRFPDTEIIFSKFPLELFSYWISNFQRKLSLFIKISFVSSESGYFPKFAFLISLLLALLFFIVKVSVKFFKRNCKMQRKCFEFNENGSNPEFPIFWRVLFVFQTKLPSKSEEKREKWKNSWFCEEFDRNEHLAKMNSFFVHLFNHLAFYWFLLPKIFDISDFSYF